MAIMTLDHYTINTLDLDATIRFYVEVLGFENGERPPFSFPGAWLYSGGKPVVHLVDGKAPEEAGSGTIDHVAFRAGGLGDFIRRFEDRGIPYSERDVPGAGIHQVFLSDPNGVTIEINFPGGEPP
ncbi:MAG: VOC family protein [Rhodospirillales bacterium]|jgi:catechol 2,3-dioxygenase-like lactoylglutathione lyase family enzyme|nr:VOC family protein [Rhodospirillales bacterium]HJO72129.1 VOC family protein [Rhodospirillales bacterium]